MKTDEPVPHRQLAVALYNRAWSLMDKPDRTEEDNEAMELAAFGSYYHWTVAGDASNRSISEWQVAHVYVLLELPDEANRFADRCIRTCEAAGFTDFKWAFGLAVKARALALRGDLIEAREVKVKADAAGKALEDEEDRDLFFEQYAAGPWFGI